MAVQVPERYQRDDAEFDRAIAFIDATFAVALTLLVTTLDIKSEGGVVEQIEVPSARLRHLTAYIAVE